MLALSTPAWRAWAEKLRWITTKTEDGEQVLWLIVLGIACMAAWGAVSAWRAPRSAASPDADKS